MNVARLIALGNEQAGDDGAALAAARLVTGDVVLAGRSGVALIDLLATGGWIVLLDVVRTGAAPGTIVRLSLEALPDAAVARAAASSHGLGPGEALRLAQALGRPTARGLFLGIEGASFDPGAPLSPEVAAAVPRLAEAARRALEADGQPPEPARSDGQTAPGR